MKRTARGNNEDSEEGQNTAGNAPAGPSNSTSFQGLQNLWENLSSKILQTLSAIQVSGPAPIVIPPVVLVFPSAGAAAGHSECPDAAACPNGTATQPPAAQAQRLPVEPPPPASHEFNYDFPAGGGETPSRSRSRSPSAGREDYEEGSSSRSSNRFIAAARERSCSPSTSSASAGSGHVADGSAAGPSTNAPPQKREAGAGPIVGRSRGGRPAKTGAGSRASSKQRAAAATRRARKPPAGGFDGPPLEPPVPPRSLPDDAGMFSADERATLNELFKLTYEIIDRGGVPQWQDLDLDSEAKRSISRSPIPELTDEEASAVLLSERVPLVIQTILQSVWPGGMSALHPPDAWILSRMWNLIREFDLYGRPMGCHLDFNHECKTKLEHRHAAYLCECWTDRLGEQWHLLTREDEMQLLPPGIEVGPPDKLIRLLTAMLDNYVKTHPLFPDRNPRYASRRQQYIWAPWVKAFVLAFLKLAGIRKRSKGQYWYLSDPQAKWLARMSGYTLEIIQKGLSNYRYNEHNRDRHRPPEKQKSVPIRHFLTPRDSYLIDEFLLPRFIRDPLFEVRTLRQSEIEEFLARTEELRHIERRKVKYRFQNWFKITGNKKRGNILVDFAQKIYDEFAESCGKEPLSYVWNESAEMDEQLFNATLKIALKHVKEEIETRIKDEGYRGKTTRSFQLLGESMKDKAVEVVDKDFRARKRGENKKTKKIKMDDDLKRGDLSPQMKLKQKSIQKNEKLHDSEISDKFSSSSKHSIPYKKTISTKKKNFLHDESQITELMTSSSEDYETDIDEQYRKSKDMKRLKSKDKSSKKYNILKNNIPKRRIQSCDKTRGVSAKVIQKLPETSISKTLKRSISNEKMPQFKKTPLSKEKEKLAILHDQNIDAKTIYHSEESEHEIDPTEFYHRVFKKRKEKIFINDNSIKKKSKKLICESSSEDSENATIATSPSTKFIHLEQQNEVSRHKEGEHKVKIDGLREKYILNEDTSILKNVNTISEEEDEKSQVNKNTSKSKINIQKKKKYINCGDNVSTTEDSTFLYKKPEDENRSEFISINNKTKYFDHISPLKTNIQDKSFENKYFEHEAIKTKNLSTEDGSSYNHSPESFMQIEKKQMQLIYDAHKVNDKNLKSDEVRSIIWPKASDSSIIINDTEFPNISIEPKIKINDDIKEISKDIINVHDNYKNDQHLISFNNVSQVDEDTFARDMKMINLKDGEKKKLSQNISALSLENQKLEKIFKGSNKSTTEQNKKLDKIKETYNSNTYDKKKKAKFFSSDYNGKKNDALVFIDKNQKPDTNASSRIFTIESFDQQSDKLRSKDDNLKKAMESNFFDGKYNTDINLASQSSKMMKLKEKKVVHHLVKDPTIENVSCIQNKEKELSLDLSQDGILRDSILNSSHKDPNITSHIYLKKPQEYEEEITTKKLEKESYDIKPHNFLLALPETKKILKREIFQIQDHERNFQGNDILLSQVSTSKEMQKIKPLINDLDTAVVTKWNSNNTTDESKCKLKKEMIKENEQIFLKKISEKNIPSVQHDLTSGSKSSSLDLTTPSMTSFIVGQTKKDGFILKSMKHEDYEGLKDIIKLSTTNKLKNINEKNINIYEDSNMNINFSQISVDLDYKKNEDETLLKPEGLNTDDKNIGTPIKIIVTNKASERDTKNKSLANEKDSYGDFSNTKFSSPQDLELDTYKEKSSGFETSHIDAQRYNTMEIVQNTSFEYQDKKNITTLQEVDRNTILDSTYEPSSTLGFDTSKEINIELLPPDSKLIHSKLASASSVDSFEPNTSIKVELHTPATKLTHSKLSSTSDLKFYPFEAKKLTKDNMNIHASKNIHSNLCSDLALEFYSPELKKLAKAKENTFTSRTIDSKLSPTSNLKFHPLDAKIFTIAEMYTPSIRMSQLKLASASTLEFHPYEMKTLSEFEKHISAKKVNPSKLILALALETHFSEIKILKNAKMHTPATRSINSNLAPTSILKIHPSKTTLLSRAKVDEATTKLVHSKPTLTSKSYSLEANTSTKAKIHTLEKGLIHSKLASFSPSKSISSLAKVTTKAQIYTSAQKTHSKLISALDLEFHLPKAKTSTKAEIHISQTKVTPSKLISALALEFYTPNEKLFAKAKMNNDTHKAKSKMYISSIGSSYSKLASTSKLDPFEVKIPVKVHMHTPMVSAIHTKSNLASSVDTLEAKVSSKIQDVVQIPIKDLIKSKLAFNSVPNVSSILHLKTPNFDDKRNYSNSSKETTSWFSNFSTKIENKSNMEIEIPKNNISVKMISPKNDFDIEEEIQASISNINMVEDYPSLGEDLEKITELKKLPTMDIEFESHHPTVNLQPYHLAVEKNRNMSSDLNFDDKGRKVILKKVEDATRVTDSKMNLEPIVSAINSGSQAHGFIEKNLPLDILSAQSNQKNTEVAINKIFSKDKLHPISGMISWNSKVKKYKDEIQSCSSVEAHDDKFLRKKEKSSVSDSSPYLIQVVTSNPHSKCKLEKGEREKSFEVTSKEATSSNFKVNCFPGGVKLCSSSLHDEFGKSHSEVKVNRIADAKPEVREVTPLTLGLETVGGVMTVIIPRNTPIPVIKRQVISTYVDNQTELSVQIYEGERLWISENNKLGSFELGEIPPALRGVQKFTVCFNIDAKGILNILVEGKTIGQVKRITISNVNERPDKEMITKMIQDADMCRIKDTEDRKIVEAKNNLENYAYELRNFFKNKNKNIINRIGLHDGEKIHDIIQSIINWLLLSNWLIYNHRQLPELDEIEKKRQELQIICKSILDKLSISQKKKFEAGKYPQAKLIRNETSSSSSSKPPWKR